MALTADTGLRLWQYKFPRVGSTQGNLGGHVTSPVVAENLVLIGASRSFLALDTQTGKIVWQFDTAKPISSSATVADGLVYFIDFDNLYAIDLKAGAERWRFAQNDLSVVFAPVVLEDQIITARTDTIYALDRHTGQEIWHKRIENVRLVPAGAWGEQVYAKSDNTLYALNRADGTELWAYHVTDFISLPAITPEVIYVITRAGGIGQLRAVNTLDGQELWQEENARLANAAPVVARGQVYVRTIDGSLLVFAES
jgi:outer membrane protein assembly factor BamB